MRPPRLPSSHPSTGLRLAIGDSSPIVLALERAGAVIDTEAKRSEIADAINEAVLRFINAREEAVPQSDFHQEIRLFREALSAFLRAAPQAGSPLSQALCEGWEAAVLQHGLSGGQPAGGRDDIENSWNFAFPHPSAFEGLRQGLYTLTFAVDALSEAEQVGIKGKPPYREDQRIVHDLRTIYEAATNVKATRSVRNQRAQAEASDQRTRAQGPFSMFVRAVDDDLFRTIVAAFTTQPVMRENGRVRAMTTHEAEAEAGKYRIRGLAAMVANALKDNGLKSAD